MPDVPERLSRLPSIIEQAIADGAAHLLSRAALDLPPGEGKLEIQYTSLRLAAPERLRFRYWMEGFERDWTAAGQRRVAYYTNLPAGQYRFHVVAYDMQRAAECDGEHPRDPPAASFVPDDVVPGVLRLMVIAGGVGRVPAPRPQHPPAVRRRPRGAQPPRSRNARHADPGLRRRLDAARGGVARAGRFPELGHDLLDRARAEVRAAVDEARLAVWDLRHGSSNGDRLVPAVSQLAHRIGLDAGIEIEVEVAGTPVAGRRRNGAEPDAAHSRSAAERHPARGAPRRLSVFLRFDPGELDVSIEDNGVGFDSSLDQSEQSQHYGLVGMRERVERLGGEFSLTSAPGAGHAGAAEDSGGEESKIT